MKVWIAKQDFAEHKKGETIYKGESWTNWKKSFCEEFDISDIENDDYLTIVEQDGSYVFSEDSTKKLRDEMETIISNMYREMTSDIISHMTDTFGTANIDSAMAYERTWADMGSNPTIYADAGLVSDIKFAEFEIGAMLDTEAKIVSYANEKCKNVTTYAAYRLKRIQEFSTGKKELIESYGL